MGADYYEGDPRAAALNLPENAPPIGIGRNCVIKRAIIDKNARIGDGVVITPDGKPDNYDSENYLHPRRRGGHPEERRPAERKLGVDGCLAQAGRTRPVRLRLNPTGARAASPR